MIDICHVESGVKILLTVLLVNCHVVSGKILDFRISRQTGLKSPFKWHKQSGQTKWRTFQQVLRYVTPSSIPPANIQSTWAKSNIVRKSFQGDVLPICGSSTQKVCLFQASDIKRRSNLTHQFNLFMKRRSTISRYMQGTSVFNGSIPKGYLVCQKQYIEGEKVGPSIQNKSVSCLSKHCDAEVPTCRPPRFQRQQLPEGTTNTTSIPLPLPPALPTIATASYTTTTTTTTTVTAISITTTTAPSTTTTTTSTTVT